MGSLAVESRSSGSAAESSLESEPGTVSVAELAGEIAKAYKEDLQRGAELGARRAALGALAHSGQRAAHGARRGRGAKPLKRG